MDRALLTQQLIDRVAQVRVGRHLNVREALEPMDRAGLGVLLIMDDDDRLAGVLTDGDVRRAILRQVPLTTPCVDIATRNPVTAPPTITLPEGLHRMSEGNGMSHLPLLDDDGRVVGLLLRTDLVDDETLPIEAVVMAGGFGKRLQPYTADTPKPMLHVGDRPMMEHLMEELRFSGIRRVSVSTFHHAEKIEDYFGDGSRFGLEVDYVREDRPLGTAGALRLMGRRAEPLLVINGDILTRVNVRAMLEFHRSHRAQLTVGVRQYDFEVPYGVVECDGERVSALREKPVVSWLVNAGVYLVEPAAQQLIPEGEHFNMTDLIDKLLERGETVVSFPVVEYWLDIGRHADYERAQIDVRSGRLER